MTESSAVVDEYFLSYLQRTQIKHKKYYILFRAVFNTYKVNIKFSRSQKKLEMYVQYENFRNSFSIKILAFIGSSVIIYLLSSNSLLYTL